MEGQRYRFRRPSSGEDVILRAQAGKTYHDEASGEELKPVGAVLPLEPSGSSLPWATGNLRFCDLCGQLTQKDLNVCPTCDRRMGPA